MVIAEVPIVPSLILTVVGLELMLKSARVDVSQMLLSTIPIANAVTELPVGPVVVKLREIWTNSPVC